jgi:hypothetical protein
MEDQGIFGLVQTSNFSCAQSNVNELSSLFEIRKYIATLHACKSAHQNYRKKNLASNEAWSETLHGQPEQFGNETLWFVRYDVSI